MNTEPETQARINMIKSQIVTGHVLEPLLLEALEGTPRARFLPEAMRAVAYVDAGLSLGRGRFLMETLSFARLLKYAALQKHETVLDIAAGTGYSSAIISQLVQKVVAVEEDAALYAQAKANLSACANIELVACPLVDGHAPSAPYDAILIEGAIEFLPGALCDQLREGGRLLAVEHDAKAHMACSGLGKLVEYKKLRGEMYKNVIRDENAALLPSFQKPHAFIL